MITIKSLTKKVRLRIAAVVRRLHFRLMTCANCGNDQITGLPIDCGYKEDFKRISHCKENKLYCSMWCEKD